MQPGFEIARARIAGAADSLARALTGTPASRRVQDAARRAEDALHRALDELDAAFDEAADDAPYLIDALRPVRGGADFAPAPLMGSLMLDGHRDGEPLPALTIRWPGDEPARVTPR